MITTTQQSAIHEREGGVWSYVSPSRLNLWMKCPLSFKLRYIDRIRTPTSSALFLGKMVHSGLELFYRNRQVGITLPVEEVVERNGSTWETSTEEEGMKFASLVEETKLREQLGNLLRVYLEQVDDEPPPVAVEAALKANLIDPDTGEDLGIPLLGVVDLIQPAEDGNCIVDFKTSARSSPPLEVSHEIQLSCYSWLYRQLTGEHESALQLRSLVKTKTPKVVCHEYGPRTDRHYRRLFSVIREYFDALDQGKFNYRPGWGCSMCDHRESHCAAWAG